MAVVDVDTLPALVTETEAVPVENIININAPFGGGEVEIGLEVITGSFQFASGAAITAENPIFTATEKTFVTVSKYSQLRFLAAAQNDDFRITT